MIRKTLEEKNASEKEDCYRRKRVNERLYGRTGPWTSLELERAAVDARHAEMVREVEFWKRQNAELSRGTEALARQIDEANKRSNP